MSTNWDAGVAAMRPLNTRHVSRAALLCAVAVCWCAPATAQTSCNATNRFTLDWDAQNPKNTALGTGSRNFTVTNGAGATVTVTMSFAGETTRYTTGGAGQAPNISVQNVGGIGAGQNTLYLATDFVNFDTDVGTDADTAVVRFGFSTAVREVTFTMLDIDYNAGQYRDWIRVRGTNGPTYVPALTTPYGNNNSGSPGVTAPGVTFVGPGTTAGYTFVSGDVAGVGNSNAADAFGNIISQFVQPITQAEVRYGNGPSTTMSGTPGLQSISIHDITFCPMPVIAIAKTSAPVSTVITDPNRFAIPGADVDYTITVTNSGGSTVDIASQLIADILPASVEFFNGDIDPGTAGVQNFVFTPNASGLTMATGNIAYSNNGGTSYVYAPPAGYAPLVNAVRFNPQGTMAANSSFTVRFRTRIR